MIDKKLEKELQGLKKEQLIARILLADMAIDYDKAVSASLDIEEPYGRYAFFKGYMESSVKAFKRALRGQPLIGS